MDKPVDSNWGSRMNVLFVLAIDKPVDSWSGFSKDER